MVLTRSRLAEIRSRGLPFCDFWVIAYFLGLSWNQVDHLYDELVGLGPLQPLMDDELTTDILVNRWDEVFVERAGRLQHTGARFRDQAHLEQLIANRLGSEPRAHL